MRESNPVLGSCIQPALNQYCAQGWHTSFVGISPVMIISTASVVIKLRANCHWSAYVGRWPVFGFCLQPAPSQYCAEGWHTSSVGISTVMIISTTLEINQLSANCHWDSYIGWQTVIAHLLCRYFASNGNQYCARSKPKEYQPSMISLLQSFASTAAPVLCQ